MTRASATVALGIFGSRMAGLVRQRVFSHYFGLQSDAADAFTAAFRIPNLLQNLFGEGALSASFIPVYSGLLAKDEPARAAQVARAVAALQGLAMAVLVLVGVLAAPVLVDLLAPGFAGGKRELTVTLVRILFPGAGILALSAWCLGVLNSHGRFLLAYSAPVSWNLAMIVALVVFGPDAGLPGLAIVLAWGSVAGSLLQLAVQVPSVRHLVSGGGNRPGEPWLSPQVRTIARTFVPALVGRGVVQISAWIDTLLASLLPTGALTALANAQMLHTLPVSLFGMSVSAAELPAMSGAAGLERADALRARLDAGLAQIAFFVVPSAMAFLVLGDVIAAALLQTGRFTRADAVFVWGVLAGSSVGLLASTLGRLYASAFHALGDTRSPLRFALVRVVCAAGLGYAAALVLPQAIGVPASWGTAGLTAASGACAWIELSLLRRGLARRLGEDVRVDAARLARLWTAAAAAALVGLVLKSVVGAWHPVLAAPLVLAPYGGIYLVTAHLMGIRMAPPRS